MGAGMARTEFSIAGAAKLADKNYMTNHIGKWCVSCLGLVHGLRPALGCSPRV